MRERVEDLWHSIRNQLASRGALPLRDEVLTPGEIAQYTASIGGDPRVAQFVWDYYYPEFYGDEQGAMTDEEADALVASLVSSAPPKSPSPAVMQPPRTPPVHCRVCARRNISGEERQ